MSLRLTDLLLIEIRALSTLDDGLKHADSIGVDADTLSPEMISASVMLVPMGLAEHTIVWRGRTWFRRTERGRQVRERGAA